MDETPARRRENEKKRLEAYMRELRHVPVAPTRMSRPELARALGYSKPAAVDPLLKGLACIRDGKGGKYLIDDIVSAIVQNELRGAN